MAMNSAQTQIASLEAKNEILNSQRTKIADENRNLHKQITKYENAIEEMVSARYKQMFEAEYQRGWWEAMDHVIQVARKPPEKKVEING